MAKKRTSGYKLKPQKHWCDDNWHWEQIHGMRLSRQEGRRTIYRVRYLNEHGRGYSLHPGFGRGC